jgi:hypothetical protein
MRVFEPQQHSVTFKANIHRYYHHPKKLGQAMIKAVSD